MSERSNDIRPWYREPWPWVAIAIPGAAVIMGIITFYLAVTNPDHLVIDDQQYDTVSSELKAQQFPKSSPNEKSAVRNDGDGEN